MDFQLCHLSGCDQSMLHPPVQDSVTLWWLSGSVVLHVALAV